jgi:AraC family transcriptional regulator
MTEQKQAIKVGTWPLPEAHDTSLDAFSIPNGALILGLFDKTLNKMHVPDAIDGLTQVAGTAELTQDTYCIVHPSSGVDYVIALTDKQIEVTGKLIPPEHKQTVRLITIPDCKMVASGVGNWDEPNFVAFDEWFSKLTLFPSLHAYDFASDCGGTGLQWLYIYDERMDVPPEFEIIDFKGGDYAVITAIDNDGSSYIGATTARDKFLSEYGLELDDTRWQLGHILSDYKLSRQLFGAGQMDCWFPIRRIPQIPNAHETVVETFDHNGAIFDVVEWTETIWCGKAAYAMNAEDETFVDRAMDGYSALDCSKANGKFDPPLDGLLNFSHTASATGFRGVMFGEIVTTDKQPDGFDVYHLPAATWMRLRIDGGFTDKQLGKEPFYGGPPPFEWIYDLVEQFGYKPGSADLPIIEYYAYYAPGMEQKYENKLYYVYAPVEKA